MFARHCHWLHTDIQRHAGASCIHTRTCIHACARARTHPDTHTHSHTLIHIREHTLYTHAHTYIRTIRYTHTHTHTLCLSLCLCLSLSYTHTHTHTYDHAPALHSSSLKPDHRTKNERDPKKMSPSAINTPLWRRSSWFSRQTAAPRLQRG